MGRKKVTGRRRKTSGQMWAERSQRKVLDCFEVYYDENGEEIHTVNKEQLEASAEETEMLDNGGAKTNEAIVLKNTEETTDSIIRADAAQCQARPIGQETKEDVERNKSSDTNKNCAVAVEQTYVHQVKTVSGDEDQLVSVIQSLQLQITKLTQQSERNHHAGRREPAAGAKKDPK